MGGRVGGQQRYLDQSRHHLGQNNDGTFIPSSSPSATINTTIGGRYGVPNTICDTPLTLIDATFDWIDKNLVGSIDFVIWTGDNARHDSDNTHPRTQEEIYALNKIVANKVLSTFPTSSPDGQRIPIIPSIGNNDVYPHNILKPGPNPIFQYFATIWSEFIPESMAKTFARGGYYSVEVVPDKITVVSLNTLYFYDRNAAVDGCKEEEQPGTEQMDWMETELDKLRHRGMVAYLTGHIPPDKKSYSPTCYLRYTKIALAYQDVVVGHLFGHANMDHFFLLSRNAKSDGGDEGGEGEEEEEEEEEVPMEERVGEHASFQALGLGTYLEDLWMQYDNVPERAQLKDYAVALVSPSVVPTYNPTLRVFTYQLNNSTDDEDNSSTSTLPAIIGEGEERQDLEDGITSHLSTDKSTRQWTDFRHCRKHHHKGRPNPVPTTTFGFPQSFTQYWCNLTKANKHTTSPATYEIEYQTREDYGLENLSVSEWLGLARRITMEEDLKKVYLDRMVVQSGANTTAL
ncbi:Endopolyphosphatase [Linnemannia exigua]|uniref:Endopolyphosphatase n=1 Tax=Linnemannia exigua TaxID=604196 RepID=A0AAD4DM94_9FUNG|nr:Endopolyphosphatase [Linnemannia exigua]